MVLGHGVHLTFWFSSPQRGKHQNKIGDYHGYGLNITWIVAYHDQAILHYSLLNG